jgi:hypothetical protein
MTELSEAVVLDIGSGTTKCCLAGDENPRAVFPSVINGKRVVNRGRVKSNDDLEALLQKAFGPDGLKVASEERPLLCTECPFNPKEARERITQLAFERFNVPAFYLSLAGLLALNASGRTTGLVAEMGYGLTSVIPIYEGYTVPFAVIPYAMGMGDTILHLKKFLQTFKAVHFSENGGKENEEAAIDTIARMINNHGITPPNNESFESQQLAYREKNKMMNCITSLAQKEEYLLSQLPAELVEEISRYTLAGPPTLTQFKLPDGQILHLGEEMLLAGQLPFQPLLYDLANQEETSRLGEYPSISEQIHNALMKINPQDREEVLWGNIIVAGMELAIPQIIVFTGKNFYKRYSYHGCSKSTR